MARLIARAILASLVCTGAAQAANFTVNQTGSQSDASTADGFCDTNPAAGNQNQCTLVAAIQQINQLSGPHNITFNSSITAITLTASLPMIIAPVTIDGVNASAVGQRVDINGGNLTGGFELRETGTAMNPNGARGSTIRNLVIRNFNDDGVDMSGHGYTVENCYIGVTPNGESASSNSDDGVTVSGTMPAPLNIPPLPGDFDFDPAAIAAQIIVLFNSIPPTRIQNNLISGNVGDGVDIFGINTALVIVTLNRIGTDDDGMSSIPNGSSGGGNLAGVRVAAGAYANIIGPLNVISGNNQIDTDDGVDVSPGAVRFPNFIAGNSIGIGADPIADVGNGGSGIWVDTRPEVDGTQPDNPTDYSLFIAGNVIADNRGENNMVDPDDGNGPNAGITITGASSRVKVLANFIGIGKFGPSPELSLDYGNAGDGIFIGTGDHEIGGSSAAEFNVISANHRHGILLTGSSTAEVVIRNNFVGVPDPTMTGLLTFGNGVDGLQINRASSNTIGGTGSLDDNVFAANGRHGVSMRNGSDTNGWANLLQRNQIYGNAQDNPAGLGIDLERIDNAPDPVPDPLDPDPQMNYANYGQTQPFLCAGQPGEPPACAGATPPSFGGSNTSLQWTLSSRPSSMFRIEFFLTTATSQTFLMEQTVTTDSNGLVNGGGCVAGLCTSSVGGSTNTQGMQVQMTATDLFPADVPPSGGSATAPSNNTSEFSNAVTVPMPGEVRFSAATYSVAEAGVMATITAVRANGDDNAVTVDYATANGTASAGSDYTAASGTLSWADGDAAPKTFTIDIASDLLDEPDETVLLALGNITGGATLGTPSNATLTITDDDATPTISIGDVSLPEGNSGTTAFAFDVMLSGASGQTVTVDFATANGSATQPGDYAPASGTVTFAPGDTAETVVVNVVGDTTSEGNEAFVVNLSNAANAGIADNQGTGTIVDDDAGPVFTIDDVAQNEGNAGTTNFMFTVTRSPATGAVSVDVASADGTATAGSDYTALATQTLNFADGIATMPVVVQVSGDTTFEPGETFTVTLSNATGGASIGDGSGLGTIMNDDGQPTIAIADVSAAEGNSGATAFTFAVTLSNASSQTVTVQASTADVSATAGSDYAALVAVPVSFAPGSVSQNVVVDVTGDTTGEPTESFVVNLANPANATIADAQATGTIVDDDTNPVFIIDDVSQNEGDAGNTTFAFTVTRSSGTGTASVQVATANGSATAGSDYTALPLTTLNFSAGVTTQPVTVSVSGDTVFEGNETFFVNLSNASAGTGIGDGSGQGSIVNDDAVPALAITDVSQVEGNAGTSAFVFTVTLDRASSQTITVSALTTNGSATSGSDYVTLPATVLTFVPGDVSETVSVTVNGDATVEPTETFTVDLSLPVNATLADAQGLGTIIDDDSGPVFVIDDVTVAEGNAGTSTMSFTVSRSPATGAASVQASTANLTATSGNDYVAVAAQTLNFADGIATQPFAVTINGDTTFEPDEMLTVQLTNASAGTTIGDASGTGTISNDDTLPGISIGDVSLAEGNAGTTAFVFTVSLTNASAQTVTVTAATVDGSATAPADYAALAAQTLSFAPGALTQTVTVNVAGDTAIEPSETFMANLTAPGNGSLADAQATGTIVNDDSPTTIFTGPTVPGTGIFTAVVNNGGPGCGFVLAQTALIAAPPGGAPVPPSLPTPDSVFPHGLVQIALSGCTVGGTVNLTYTYPQALPPGTVFWKYGRTPTDQTPHWYQPAVTIGGNQATFSITDGGVGDDDLVADGNIIDPAGPAIVVTGTPGGDTVGIPATDWRGLIVLAAAFLLIANAVTRRRGISARFLRSPRMSA